MKQPWVDSCWTGVANVPAKETSVKQPVLRSSSVGAFFTRSVAGISSDDVNGLGLDSLDFKPCCCLMLKEGFVGALGFSSSHEIC